MSLIEKNQPYLTPPDEAPPEAGLPFEPAPGDWLMFEAGHMPEYSSKKLGSLAIGHVDHEPVILEVWPATRS
jgi:hypothetical protein